MHSNSRLLFQKYAKRLIVKGQRILEIGPDGFPSTYRRLTEDVSCVWHTLDIYDNSNLTYSNSKEYSFAIPDDSYDVVLSGQVIEHVRRPWRWLPELARVTRHGGLVITINPVSWIYHEAPIDCWRIYPEGMKALYEDASLTVLMSIWESLETPHYQKYQPGISMEDQTPKRRAVSKILGRLGFAVERAYDTVTIGRKGDPVQSVHE
jgi:ubiquinone/menaquinone biosynthesis C-methylase UbiE